MSALLQKTFAFLFQLSSKTSSVFSFPDYMHVLFFHICSIHLIKLSNKEIIIPKFLIRSCNLTLFLLTGANLCQGKRIPPSSQSSSWPNMLSMLAADFR